MTELVRSRPIWSRSVALTTSPATIYIPDDAREIAIQADAESYACLDGAYTAPAVSSVNGVITISSIGTPTGGTFKLRANPGSGADLATSALAYNISAANVKTALIALGIFATGDITAAGGALPTAITLTFTGVYAGTVPILVISDVDLTGGMNPSIRSRVTTLAAGNGGYGYVPADTVMVFNRTRDFRGARGDQFLHLATVSDTGTALVTAYS